MTERDRFIASLISTGSSIEMAQRQAAVLMASSSTSSHTAAINREPLSHDAPSSSSAGNGGSPNGGPPGGTSDNSISEFNFAQFLNGFQNQQAETQAYALVAAMPCFSGTHNARFEDWVRSFSACIATANILEGKNPLACTKIDRSGSGSV